MNSSRFTAHPSLISYPEVSIIILNWNELADTSKNQ